MRDDITLQLAKIWYAILVWERVIRHMLLPDSQTHNPRPKSRVGAGVIYVKHSGRPVPTQETKGVWAKFSQVSTSASYVSREHAQRMLKGCALFLWSSDILRFSTLSLRLNTRWGSECVTCVQKDAHCWICCSISRNAGGHGHLSLSVNDSLLPAWDLPQGGWAHQILEPTLSFSPFVRS